MKAILGYFSEVKGELARVVWPKRSEVVNLTLIVFVISAIVGIYLGGLDLAFTKMVEVIFAN